MRHSHLGWPHALYTQLLASGALPVADAQALRHSLVKLGVKRVLLYGSNKGTGAAVLQALGPLVRGFVNSDTLFPGMPADCDAVVLALAPRHYASALDRLEADMDLGEAWVLTLFDAQPESAEPKASTAAPAHGKRVRPCHLEDMFINHAGEIFPCCLTWSDPAKRIGHLNDPDILERLQGYDIRPCQCEPWSFNSIFRPALSGETARIRTLNLELSLFCNSRCAMCCVHAPEYTEVFKRPDYSLYPQLLALVERLRPELIYLQGGELLVQDRFLELCQGLRQRSPETRLALITNGNVPERLADSALETFDSLVVSLYGHSQHTYKLITGLEVGRAQRFCERVAAKDPLKLTLKYLATPVNFHEAALFTQWAVDLRPRGIQVIDANSQDYVRYARPQAGPGFDPGRNALHDLYWERVFTRGLRELERVARANAAKLAAQGTSLTVCGGVFDLLGVDAGRWTAS